MATVTGLTAARMLEIEAASIVSAQIVNDELILTTHGGTTIDAGSVSGLTAAEVALVVDERIAATGGGGLSPSSVLAISNLPPGSVFPYKCPGGVMPLRGTVTTRTDIYIDWQNLTSPTQFKTTTGYAIPGDTFQLVA